MYKYWHQRNKHNTLDSLCSNEVCEENSIIKSVQKMGHYFTYLQQKVIFLPKCHFHYVLLNFPSLAFNDILARSHIFLVLKVMFSPSSNFILIANQSTSSTSSRPWLWIYREERGNGIFLRLVWEDLSEVTLLLRWAWHLWGTPSKGWCSWNIVRIASIQIYTAVCGSFG